MWEVNDDVTIKILEVTPFKRSIQVEKSFLDSTIRQVITIYSKNEREGHSVQEAFKLNVPYCLKKMNKSVDANESSSLPVALDVHCFNFEIKPFEIKTFWITMK